MKLSNTLATISLISILVACSKQGEGDRCLTNNNDADCESGLVCTPKEELRESRLTLVAPADRCCPPEGGPKWTDARCEPAGSSPAPAGGASGTTHANGTAGSVNTTGTSGGTSSVTTGAEVGVAGSTGNSDASVAGSGG